VPGRATGPAPPKPRADYPHQFYRSFKGNAGPGGAFELVGPNAERSARFEPPGLRIVLPAGQAGVRVATGLVGKCVIKGDCEITVGYEVLREPDPADAGEGTGLFLGVDRSAPAPSGAILARGARQGRRLTTWLQLAEPGADQPWLEELRPFPSAGTSGQLRLVRSGSVLYSYLAEQPPNFVLLGGRPFGEGDLRAVRLGGQTGGPRAGLDVRILNLRIRADYLEGLADEPAAAVPTAPEKGWLAGGVFLGLAGVVSLLLGAWFFLRRRAGVPRTPAGPEPSPASLAFRCAGCGRNLKAKPELAGKKLRCPQCGQGVMVRAPR
jgi:DNA-directed RNA polymerase subunit RPC12/RpoP